MQITNLELNNTNQLLEKVNKIKYSNKNKAYIIFVTFS